MAPPFASDLLFFIKSHTSTIMNDIDGIIHKAPIAIYKFPVSFVIVANLNPTRAEVGISIIEFATKSPVLIVPSLKLLSGDIICHRPNRDDAITAAITNEYFFSRIFWNRPHFHSDASQAASSALDTLALNTLPSSKVEFGQLGCNFSFVLPIPLPPEVAKGMMVLPVKS